MLLLVIDTATPAVTTGVVELADAPRMLAERVEVNARAHAELVTPQALASLDEAGVGFADLDAVVVGAGPGPFTGLRVGIATAAAYGHALDVPVYPVCSLDGIAADVAGAVLVATDARRREVYWAGYGADGTRAGAPRVGKPADLAGHGYPVAAGNGARQYVDALGVAAVEPEYPSTRGLVAAVAGELRAAKEPGPLTPLYLRRPDAQPATSRKRVLRP